MQSIKKDKIWVLWKSEVRNEKKTKIPYYIKNDALTLASSTDPDTWSDFHTLNKIIKGKPKDKGIGIVFEPTVGIIGVDFDKCVTDGVIDKAIIKFVNKAKTYCEYSPSGTGIHLLFQSSEPIKLEKNKHYITDIISIETYTWGRYFTFTEKETEQSKPLRRINQDDFTTLLATLGYPWKKEIKVTQKDTPPIVPLGLDDETILKKMFASKNGANIKRLYDGDTSEYNNDISSSDFAMCLQLSFWTGRDSLQIEKIWLASPLGQREKTQSRADYRNKTIENAVSATTDVYSPPQNLKINGTDYDFILSRGKDPYPMLIFPNICRVLRKDLFFAGKFRKNDFSHLVESCFVKPTEWEVMNDDIVSKVREYIAEKFDAFNKLSKDMTVDSLIRVAGDNPVNPPRDYFTSLKWDGTPRLNSWLHHAYGVPDDALNQAIGSNWIKGLVKRVMKPGCQFDEVLALESPQGWRKSTSIRVLGQPWHVETTHSMDSKDFYLLIAQNVIVEFSEGEIFNRASVSKLKAEITKTEDQVRPPYERGTIKFKRSCVFAVTTNKLELKDDTGNRRWLPVSLEKPADIDWLKKHRDQLYAEAYNRVIVTGETTYEYPQDELESLQSSRAETSIFDEEIILWVATFSKEELEEDGVSLHEACKLLYGKDAKISRLEEIQTTSILRRTMCMFNKNKKIKGAVVKRWFPTVKTYAIIKDVENDEF